MENHSWYWDKGFVILVFLTPISLLMATLKAGAYYYPLPTGPGGSASSGAGAASATGTVTYTDTRDLGSDLV